MWIFIFRKIRSYNNWSGPGSKKEQWETCILNVESSSYSKFVFQQLGRIVSARLWTKATQNTMKQSSCAYISPTPACAVDFWNQMEERCACKMESGALKVQKTGAEHLLGHWAQKQDSAIHKARFICVQSVPHLHEAHLWLRCLSHLCIPAPFVKRLKEKHHRTVRIPRGSSLWWDFPWSYKWLFTRVKHQCWPYPQLSPQTGSEVGAWDLLMHKLCKTLENSPTKLRH